MATALWVCAIAGVGLRLMLFWVNPPRNAFDNHIAPVLWIMKTGSIPPKDALWQSYQPPVFYVVSAIAGRVAEYLGLTGPLLHKVLQFVSCLFGLLTLWVTWLILKRVPLSDFARLLAFGTACFLPQHIYATAMHSNDTTAHLGVTVCAWLMLVAHQRGFPLWSSMALGLATTAALFTKYNAFVVLPMMLALLAPLGLRGGDLRPRRRAAAWALGFVLPLLALCAYGFLNWKTYGEALPWNTARLDPSRSQPRAASGLSFVSFEPWKVVATPILAPWNIDSFWTLMHGRTWHDMEPKFLSFLDQHAEWWSRYYAWQRGEQAFPSGFPWTPFTRAVGSTLIALGLLPLALMLAGLGRALAGGVLVPSMHGGRRWTGLQILPVLLLANAAGIVY